MTPGRPEKAGSNPRRRRPSVSSEHFQLNWRRSAEGEAHRLQPLHRAPRLTLAVAKKLLPRAVDRNRLRRIAREAWRAAAPCHPDLDVFIRLHLRPSAGLLPEGQQRKAWRAELDGLLSRLPGGVLLVKNVHD